jgi:signal transduction histidine kinase/ActR/RegA family two-component response regulator
MAALQRMAEAMASGDSRAQSGLEQERTDFSPLASGLRVVGERLTRAQDAAAEAAAFVRLDLQRLESMQQIMCHPTGDESALADLALSAALTLTSSGSGWLAVAADDLGSVTVLAWQPCTAPGASLERSRAVHRDALGPLADLLLKGKPMSDTGGLVFSPDLRLAVELPGWEHGYAAVSSSNHGDGPVLLLAVGDRDRAYAQVELRQMALLIDEVQLVFALRRHQQRQERRTGEMDRGRRIEALSRLAGAVAHDFNNQLSAIAGYADLLRRRADQTAFVRDAASRIDHAVAQAAQLTNRLRAFAQSGLPGAQPCDLHRLLEQALAIVQPTFGTSVVVSQSLSATRTATTGDSARLVQALVTLFARARDAMPSGGVLLVATRDVDGGIMRENHDLIGEPPAHEGKFVALSVTDHGPELDAQQRQHLFEPFALASGDGLGLATAYATIRDHGGTVAVSSQAGVGTTVTLFIPIRAATQPAEHEAAVAIPTQTKLRVLVVDNEVSVRAVLVDQLEELGHTVTACDSGLGALDRLRADPKAFDLAIVDLRMPSLNGAICTERIRELNPDMHVLVCSGSTKDDPLAQEAFKAGAVGFLRKPLRLADLSQAIHEVTHGRPVS